MRRKRLILFMLLIVLIFCGTISGMLYFGILKFNNPSTEEYPVRGVDISSYQGDIDWIVLGKQDIQFAFIKATEGSSFVDPNFSKNYSESQNTDFRIGAYHFFSFDSGGTTQAQNFINNVYKIENMLPPVVDFEFYGDKRKNPPETQSVRIELNILLNELEEQYHVKPIIYATEETYNLYLSGYYELYDIWIRNVITKPKPLHNQSWTFWQYTDRERLEGYRGEEYYIDMNVFNGSSEEFSMYGKNANN